MSIKRVRCPDCQTGLNIPASMASTKCPQCGTVFSPDAPQQSAPQRSGPQRSGPQRSGPGNRSASAAGAGADQVSSGESSSSSAAAWLVFGGVLALALVGIAGLTLLRPGETPPPEAERPTAMPAAETSSENAQAEPTTEYRVVDLPEKTRRQIFNDYQRMMASSFGKAKKIPEGGAAGQALRGMLQATVDREITQMALIHGVSEQDIRQIIAEGKTKGW